MNPLSDLEIIKIVSSLQSGDTVMLTSGKTAAFVRKKKTKFVGIMDGLSYDIPMDMITEVLGKADASRIHSDYKTLKPGEAFYINKSGKAGLYFFVKIQNNYIIGINPISKTNTRIDSSMYVGKVADFKI
jgi:hypothetical protein